MKPFLILLFIITILSAERLNIAVLDLKSVGISADNSFILSNKLRSDLVNTGGFQVIERGEMTRILEEQEFQQIACTEDDCSIVEVGQILGVSHIVTGTVSKMSDLFYLNIKLTDVESGKIIKSIDEYVKGEITTLLIEGMPKVAEEFASSSGQSKAITITESVPKRKVSTFQWIRRIGGFGIGVAGIAGGYFVNKNVEKLSDEYHAIEEYNQKAFDEKRDKIDSEVTLRNILYGVGAAGGALSLISIKF